MRSFNDIVKDEDIIDSFQGIAPDLLAACEYAGEVEAKIHLGDAADAVWNALPQVRDAKDVDTSGAFRRIKQVLRSHYIQGRGQYIYL